MAGTGEQALAPALGLLQWFSAEPCTQRGAWRGVSMKGLISVPRGLIWRNIPSLREFSAVTRQSPFPVDAVGEFLQGCQAALTAPKCSPDCGGLMGVWSQSLFLEVEYFPVQCRRSQVLFSQKPLPKTCLALLQTHTCVAPGSHSWCVCKQVKNIAPHLSA